ncbi:MAG: STAS domain-containing protein [Synergistaceae bacterium]|nr:STAS domain-containing protein [Synergistaceae bacterium]
MDINITNDEGRVVVGLSGRLDNNTAPLLQDAFTEMGEDVYKTDITMDFSALDYVSSAGLRVLLFLQKKTLAAKGSLQVKNLCPTVLEVFEMTGFSAVLDII